MMTQTTRAIFTRDFIFGFLAYFTFLVVFHILIPTLPIYLSRLGAKETEIGVLIGIFFVSSLVLRPIVGKALLRTPEKMFMMAGALLFSIASVAYLWAPPFWPLLMVRVFQGVGLAFFHTAAITLIANISSDAHRGQSLSYFLLAPNLSLALAPSFGMFLINHFSFTVLFLSCLGISLCSLLISNQVKKTQVVAPKDLSSTDALFLSWKALPSSIVNFFLHFTWGALGAFFPLYAINHGVANPGLFFTTIAIMLMLGRVLGGRILDLYNREKVILLFLITHVIAMSILAFSKSLGMFILVGAIWGMGTSFLTPALMVYTLDRVGSSPGPAMGTFTAVADLGVALGPTAMGIVIHMTSYPIMFLCLVLTSVINLSYFHFFVREKG